MTKGLRFAAVADLPPSMRGAAQAELDRTAKPSKPTRSGKYANQSVRIDDIRFDSKREGAYYARLKRERAGGLIRMFHRQVVFDLPGGVTYRCDFQIINNDNSVRYVDAKGVETDVFIMKRKQVRAIYGIEIELA
jgi:hypothetical protein